MRAARSSWTKRPPAGSKGRNITGASSRPSPSGKSFATWTERMSTMAQSVKSFVVDLLRVRVYPTHHDLVQNAPRELHRYFHQLFLAQGRPPAVLATGHSQLKL